MKNHPADIRAKAGSSEEIVYKIKSQVWCNWRMADQTSSLTPYITLGRAVHNTKHGTDKWVTAVLETLAVAYLIYILPFPHTTDFLSIYFSILALLSQLPQKRKNVKVPTDIKNNFPK